MSVETERTLLNLDERVDMSNTDDVWRDGYEAGFDACLQIVRELRNNSANPQGNDDE